MLRTGSLRFEKIIRPFVNEKSWPKGTLSSPVGSKGINHIQGAACLFSPLTGLKPTAEALCWRGEGLLRGLFFSLRRLWGVWLLSSPAFQTGLLQAEPSSVLTSRKFQEDQMLLFLYFPVGFQMPCFHPTGLIIMPCLYPSIFLLSCWAWSERRSCKSWKRLVVQWFPTLVS